MGFITTGTLSILYLCILNPSFATIAQDKIVEQVDWNDYNVHITERGTKLIEKIRIDEENNLVYFHVPAHNGLAEADYLFDFNKKISLRCTKSEAKCYLGPLPHTLPKPADLRTGLQMTLKSPSKSSEIVRKYWAVAEEVDKTLLSEQVQEFCGQFPVIRLEEVDLNSVKTGIGKERNFVKSRLARSDRLKNMPLCSPLEDSKPKKECNPDTWLFNLQISGESCTYWIKNCNLDKGSKKICPEWEHKYTSMICYKIRCP
ncbi:uncharacterized protein LOC111326527 isoform X2 [Stylophora pistillata]|uniref:uncharacterized protein LOC111326527 isoform X2 n=1 Tax=Stylophora pistillata TaxID=50429 RepID=UPI000C04DCBC|nr:uncharacterized protein LOC111326527 isoform X2 [Stylophora pistillata]